MNRRTVARETVPAPEASARPPLDPHGLLADPTRRLATLAELAAMLRVSQTTVKRVCWHAGVPHVRRWPNRLTSFDVEAVLAALVAAAGDGVR
jgi:hypothetical protein